MSFWVFIYFLDSPMDMSIVEGEERTMNVNEVTDYAAEIHTHLREMEVCKCGYMLEVLNGSGFFSLLPSIHSCMLCR